MSLPIKDFKDRLKEAMIIRNIKQVELVEKTGIPKAAISQYLSGYAKPKQDRIYLLSKALDVDETWLIGYDVPINSADKYSSIEKISENFIEQLLTTSNLTLDNKLASNEEVLSIVSALNVAVELAKRNNLPTQHLANQNSRVQEAEESYIKSRSMNVQQMDGTASSSIGDTERKVSNQ